MSIPEDSPEADCIVGIDLGTSNCAVAWANARAGARIHDFPLQQWVDAGFSAARPLLPSCLYLAAEGEFPGLSGGPFAGVFARNQGARVSGRLVASSKSWLCHAAVDRRAALLPQGAPPELAKLSPLEAATRLLQHLAACWKESHPLLPLEERHVVLTVPASFDEVARSLTVEAAKAAGLQAFRLVEEPQAAFSDYVYTQGPSALPELDGVRLVLVVDVGGGTTDLTLVAVERAPESAEPLLRRIAVGEHLMLGGDNMDAALAKRAEQFLCGETSRLDAARWGQLLQACREAKEVLLAGEAPPVASISVAGSGSRLLGRVLSCQLEREEVRTLLLDGFFPSCAAGEFPLAPKGGGLRELGLPYARDAAITRQVSGFLMQNAGAMAAVLGERKAALPRPDAVLLNGGVFRAPLVAQRLLSVFASWWPEQGAPRLLSHGSLDQAVARGAVAHGLALRGHGLRVGAGAPHALYVALAGAGDAALCVVARGDSDGVVHEINRHPLELVLNQPVRFPLLASVGDDTTAAGTLVTRGSSLRPVSPLHATLSSSRQQSCRVHLRASLTELGILELRCVAEDGSGEWLLEFDIRGGDEAVAASAATDGSSPQTPSVLPLLEAAFGEAGASMPAKDLRQLMRRLEEQAGPREEWGLDWLRLHWDRLEQLGRGRRRNAEQERAWYQMLGYFLRPGFGAPGDDWRCARVLEWFEAGPRNTQDPAVWSEFWVMLRRVCSGLDASAQEVVWARLRPHLARRVPAQPPRNLPRPKGVQPEGLEEMVRLAASLEWLPLVEKEALASWLLDRLEAPGKGSGPWAWALGRLGARVPVRGSLHLVAPPGLAADWLRRLAARRPAPEGAAFALAQMARLTGDRNRDLDTEALAFASAQLVALGASDSWGRLLREVVVPDQAETSRTLGDHLPHGLRLLTE